MNHRMMTVLCIPVIALSACASATSSKSSEGDFWITMRAETVPFTRVIPAPVDKVYKDIASVFTQYGYPGGYGGNGRTYMTRQLAVTGKLYQGEANSDYFDCGVTPAGNLAADEYAISFAMLARMSENPAGGTLVEVVIDGKARARGQSSNAIFCRGKGKLENAVLEGLAQKAAGN